MARTSQLEEQLSAATRHFVAEIVAIIRRASFSDVAGFDPNRSFGSGGAARSASAGSVAAPSASNGSLHIGRGRRAAGSGSSVAFASHAKAASVPAKKSAAAPRESASRRPRQTAEKRAEIAEKILDALQSAGAPIGVRALASELHVATDLLNAPLIELRSAGKISKHGEKRATTYALP